MWWVAYVILVSALCLLGQGLGLGPGLDNIFLQKITESRKVMGQKVFAI